MIKYVQLQWKNEEMDTSLCIPCTTVFTVISFIHQWYQKQTGERPVIAHRDFMLTDSEYLFSFWILQTLFVKWEHSLLSYVLQRRRRQFVLFFFLFFLCLFPPRNCCLGKILNKAFLALLLLFFFFNSPYGNGETSVALAFAWYSLCLDQDW